MFCEKLDSAIMKEALKILSCSNGWCYGVLWGFDQTKTLLLTLKDAYYEEQMGALIDSMLSQVHVLGGGVIGQVAFTNAHQWIHSDTHRESRNSLASSHENFDLFQDDAEFYTQFFMGIKTIALISIEPWGVVQFGSTQKNPETKGFVDLVRSLFGEVRFLEDESPCSSQILDPATHFSSKGSMEANDHYPLTLPPESVLSTSTDQLEDCYIIKPANMFDCSVLTSSWPHFNCEETQNLIQRPSSLLTMEELFQESDPSDEFSQWFLPQSGLGPNITTATTTSFTSLPNTTAAATDLSHSTGLIPLSCPSVNNSPVHVSEINSTHSSFTLGSSNPDIKYPGTSGPEKPLCASGCKRALTWDETLVPVGEKYAGAPSKTSLFSKLGLDQLLDSGGVKTSSTGCCSFARPGSEDRLLNSAAKRRKTDSCPLSLNQGKSKGPKKSLKTQPKREDSIGDSCYMEGGNMSSSERQEETAKNEKKKKKAKAGTKPRPKDRQMIQDRLGDLRKLIPNGEKMSIDRLLERTIRHMNFMQSLVKHAESLKEIHKSKSRDIPKNGDGVGVTWACEVGDQSVGCPLVVEDLVTPGQMIIEMLGDELGFFLEISDMIRGFGFIILKGVMEVLEPKKIRAHFLVQAEGTRRVTRHDVFSYLIQFLQMTGKSTASADVIMPSANNCQPAVRIPMDARQRANF